MFRPGLTGTTKHDVPVEEDGQPIFGREMAMESIRFWKIYWLVAVWHNVIGGVGLLFLGDWLYLREGLTPPAPGVNYIRGCC